MYGKAFIGGVCIPTEECSVVKEPNLGLYWGTAHEIGHK